ncbi:MAG: hypothetical protein ACK4RM_00200 [Flavobacterium sp.]
MKNILSLGIALISIILGLFFIYKGVNKHFLSPCKLYGLESSIPIEYQQVITNMCQSGMLKVIGFFQVVSGMLLLMPKTRLVGAIVLLPIIFNIFILHLFLDNRPHELVETGIPLIATVLIISYYFPIWRNLFTRK